MNPRYLFKHNEFRRHFLSWNGFLSGPKTEVKNPTLHTVLTLFIETNPIPDRCGT